MSHFYTDFTLQLNSPPMARFFMLVKNNPRPNHFFTSPYDISKLATPPTIDMVQPVQTFNMCIHQLACYCSIQSFSIPLPEGCCLLRIVVYRLFSTDTQT